MRVEPLSSSPGPSSPPRCPFIRECSKRLRQLSIVHVELPLLLSPSSIEARHQTTLNILNGATFVPQAFDMALTPPQVLALAGGFLTGCTADDLGLTSQPQPNLLTVALQLTRAL